MFGIIFKFFNINYWAWLELYISGRSWRKFCIELLALGADSMAVVRSRESVAARSSSNYCRRRNDSPFRGVWPLLRV